MQLTIGETLSDFGEAVVEDTEYGYQKTVEGIEVAGEAVYDAGAATGQAIEYGAQYAFNNTLEVVRDGLDFVENGIDNALGDDDSDSDEEAETYPQPTENQEKCNQIFQSYDTDGNQLLSWSEW